MIQKKSLKDAIQNPEIISVIRGLIGTANNDKNGLMSSESFKKTILQRYNETPYISGGNIKMFQFSGDLRLVVRADTGVFKEYFFSVDDFGISGCSTTYETSFSVKLFKHTTDKKYYIQIKTVSNGVRLFISGFIDSNLFFTEVDNITSDKTEVVIK